MPESASYSCGVSVTETIVALEKYGLEHICCTSYIDEVLIDWTRDFGDWLDRVTERADRGDRHSQLMLELVTAEFSDLTSMPDVDTPTRRRSDLEVSQSN